MSDCPGVLVSPRRPDVATTLQRKHCPDCQGNEKLRAQLAQEQSAYRKCVADWSQLEAHLAQATAALQKIVDRVVDAALFYGAERMPSIIAQYAHDIAKKALTDLDAKEEKP